ncbi:MAG: phosphate signaling complex protein PhoU [Micrococcaceae bacterium]
MRNMYRAELDQIAEGITEIAQLVNTATKQATDALFNNNLELAEEVIEGDSQIDQQQISLDEHSIDIIARQAPVASDLRILVASLRMSASLERMGDLARHTSQLVRLRYPEEVVPKELESTFKKMAKLDIEITDLLVKLLEERNFDIIERIIRLKEKVSQIHMALFTTLNSGEHKLTPQQTIDLVLLSRYFERISDHAVSVSTKVYYLATGEWRTGTLPLIADEDE